MPKEVRMVSDIDLKKLDWAEEFFEQHRPDVHTKRHITILTRTGYIGTKHDLPQETVNRIREFLQRENIEYIEEIKTNRCQIAHDITEDISREQCKIDDDKCKIAREISNDIISRECIEELDAGEKLKRLRMWDSVEGKVVPEHVMKQAEKEYQEDIDDAFYNFLQKDFEEAGYYIEYVNEDSNYMFFKLIDKKTNKKSRIIELTKDRLCKEVSAGRGKYLAREVIEGI